jgi:putative spermidine/putrescine transport system permease protein
MARKPAERSQRWLAGLLILPTVAYLFPIYLASLGILLVFSFYRFVPGGPLLRPDFTFANYVRFLDPLYAGILTRTMVVGFIASVSAVVVAYPMAYWLNRSQSRWRSVCVAMLVLSFFVITVVRVFAWTLVLGREGFLNKLLKAIGFIDQPLQFMYNEIGVTLVLIHYLMPAVTLVLATSLQRIDRTLELASQNLGANKIHTFFAVTLPLSIPGIVGALTLAFALSISTFTTPVIIGGGRVLLLANTLYDTMFTSMNFPFASALAIITLVFSLFLVAFIGRFLMSRLRLVQ